jgi:HSP20 family protein
MTSVTRWNPIDELLATWPRSFFGRDLFTGLRPNGELKLEWNPRCDVSESDGAVVIHAELPGVEAKDMDVSISGSQLIIRGEKRSETREEKEGETYQERFFGSFERTFALPEGVAADEIAASLKDGVLEVRLPRIAPKAAESKKVQITTG